MKQRSQLIFATFLAASIGLANATTHTVTSLNDNGGLGTLRTLINASVAGDTINFAVFGTITLTNELVIGRNLTINGPGAPILTVSGNNNSRVFNIQSNATVSISGLTISSGLAAGTNGITGTINTPNGGSGGDGLGGGIINSGRLTLSSCFFSVNSAQGGSGGIPFHPGSFCGNGGSAYGGAIYNSGTLSMFDCSVAGSTATGGAGGAGSAFYNGYGGLACGGGIYNSGSLALTQCTLGANTAQGGAGGTPISDAGSGNSGGNASGGAIYSLSPQCAVIACTLALNSAIAGNGGGGSMDLSSGGPGGNAFAGGFFSSTNSPQSSIFARDTVTAGAGGTDEHSVTAANGSASGIDVYGVVASAGHNLVGASDFSSGWTGTDNLGSAGAALDPLLGTFTSGGLGIPHVPCPVMLLQSGSAAIDRGDDSLANTLVADQRGYYRKVGTHVDIGACEYNSIIRTNNYAFRVGATPGLLGYWRFAPYVFSAQYVTNSLDNAYTGSLQGSAAIGTPGSGYPMPLDTAYFPYNQSLVLDGNSSYLFTSLTDGITNQGTIIAWINLATQPSTAGHVFEIAAQSQFGDDFDLQIETDNHLHFYTDNGSATVYAQSLPLNQWHFVAATFVANGNRLIYLDGVPVANSTCGAHSASAQNFTIGASQLFGGRFFEGAITETAVFSRALAPQEIAAFYSASGNIPQLLSISSQPGNVVLSWSTNLTGFTLQQSASLIPTAWSAVPGTPGVLGADYAVTNGINGRDFYRLLSP